MIFPPNNDDNSPVSPRLPEEQNLAIFFFFCIVETPRLSHYFNRKFNYYIRCAQREKPQNKNTRNNKNESSKIITRWLQISYAGSGKIEENKIKILEIRLKMDKGEWLLSLRFDM